MKPTGAGAAGGGARRARQESAAAAHAAATAHWRDRQTDGRINPAARHDWLCREHGYAPMTREEASLFFRLVSSRYGRGAFAIGLERMATRWLAPHPRQEHPGLDRASRG